MDSLNGLFFNHSTAEGIAYEDILGDIQKYCTANHTDTPSGETDPEQTKKLLKEFILQYLIKCSYEVEGMSSTELCEDLYEDMAGFSLLKRWVYRRSVEEVNINAYNDIEVVTNGERSTRIPEKFQSPQHAIDVTQRLLSTYDMVIDNTMPSVIGYLDKNIRISVDKTPIVDAGVRTNASIRIVNQQSMSREKLIDSGSATERMLDFLVCCIHYGISVYIAGSIGFGKTTVMSWLLSMVPDNHRLIATEGDSHEFSLVREDTDDKVLNSVAHLLTRPRGNPTLDIGRDALLERILRKHPNVIGIGEVRSTEETLSVAENSRTGHIVVTIIHSSSAGAIHRRMMTLAKRKYDMAGDTLIQIMVEAYPVIIFTKQLEDDSREVMQIVEGEDYTDRKLQYRTLYRYNVEDNRVIAGKTQVFGEHKKLNPFTDNLKKRPLDNGIFQLELKKLIDERREP